MALDFPNAPTNGTTYAPGAPALGSWVYDGAKWNAQGGANALTTISDTAPVGYPAGSLWWNSSAGDGQLYLYYNDGTSSQWVVANNPGSGIYLPLVGGQLNPGGLLVGTAGTVPGQGALTLNANTVAPPAGLSPNLYVVGANNAGSIIGIDGFSSGQYDTPGVFMRRARGTAAAPAAVQNGDELMTIQSTGYGGGAYGTGNAAAINVLASENWTGTARGTNLYLQTTPAGSASPVNSLTLAGNTATFSGTVSVPTGQGIYLNGGSSGTAARLVTDGNNFIVGAMTNAGAFIFTIPSGNNPFVCDNGGNITILGSSAVKASGTTWSNPSSRDIKNDIQPYDKGLQAILALKPSTYRFQRGLGLPEGRHIGLVHDETKHMPEMHRTLTLGSGDDAREVDGLDCSAVTWALVNALKEIDQRLKAGGL